MNPAERTFTLLIASTRVARNSLSQLLPPLIPILVVALRYPLWQLGLLVTLFTLGTGTGQAPVGVIADRYDRRYVLPVGFVVAGASYLLFAVAPHLARLAPGLAVGPFDAQFVVMAGAMFLVGVGCSVVHPTVYPMITENVRPAHKGKVLGIFGSAAKMGGAIVPLVVGLLVLTMGWAGIVAVLGAFGIGYGVALFVVLGRFETRPASIRALEDGVRDGSDDRGDATATEHAEAAPDAQPGSDHRAYRYPLLVIYGFFITRAFAGTGMRTFIPAFIVGVYGYTLGVAGMHLAAESVANFYLSALLFVGAGTQIALGYVIEGYDARTALIGFMLVATAGILVLAYVPLSPLLLLAVLFVVGASIWGLNPARDLLISDITPPDREGRTFGYLWTASSLTGALIPTLVGYLADVLGLRESFGILAVGTLLAAGCISFLYSERVYVPADAASTAD